MQLSQRPRRITRPWASSAGGSYVRTVPDAAPAGTTGAASYEKGFPPETFQPVGSGGIPPSGQDMNGALADQSAMARWLAAGGTASYDSTFASAVGGYPNLAVLASLSVPGRLYMSTADNNTTDPDSGSAANWQIIVAGPSTDPNVTYFPDGSIDQRGEVLASSTGQPVVTANLVVPFANALYNVQVTPLVTNPTTVADTWVQLIRSSRTTTSFQVQYQNGGGGTIPNLDGFTWRAIGR